jgi:hypothetical protein
MIAPWLSKLTSRLQITVAHGHRRLTALTKAEGVRKIDLSIMLSAPPH